MRLRGVWHWSVGVVVVVAVAAYHNTHAGDDPTSPSLSPQHHALYIVTRKLRSGQKDNASSYWPVKARENNNTQVHSDFSNVFQDIISPDSRGMKVGRDNITPAPTESELHNDVSGVTANGQLVNGWLWSLANPGWLYQRVKHLYESLTTHRLYYHLLSRQAFNTLLTEMTHVSPDVLTPNLFQVIDKLYYQLNLAESVMHNITSVMQTTELHYYLDDDTILEMMHHHLLPTSYVNIQSHDSESLTPSMLVDSVVSTSFSDSHTARVSLNNPNTASSTNASSRLFTSPEVTFNPSTTSKSYTAASESDSVPNVSTPAGLDFQLHDSHHKISSHSPHVVSQHTVHTGTNTKLLTSHQNALHEAMSNPLQPTWSHQDISIASGTEDVVLGSASSTPQEEMLAHPYDTIPGITHTHTPSIHNDRQSLDLLKNQSVRGRTRRMENNSERFVVSFNISNNRGSVVTESGDMVLRSTVSARPVLRSLPQVPDLISRPPRSDTGASPQQRPSPGRPLHPSLPWVRPGTLPGYSQHLANPAPPPPEAIDPVSLLMSEGGTTVPPITTTAAPGPSRQQLLDALVLLADLHSSFNRGGISELPTPTINLQTPQTPGNEVQVSLSQQAPGQTHHLGATISGALSPPLPGPHPHSSLINPYQVPFSQPNVGYSGYVGNAGYTSYLGSPSYSYPGSPYPQYPYPPPYPYPYPPPSHICQGGGASTSTSTGPGSAAAAAAAGGGCGGGSTSSSTSVGQSAGAAPGSMSVHTNTGGGSQVQLVSAPVPALAPAAPPLASQSAAPPLASPPAAPPPTPAPPFTFSFNTGSTTTEAPSVSQEEYGQVVAALSTLMGYLNRTSTQPQATTTTVRPRRGGIAGLLQNAFRRGSSRTTASTPSPNLPLNTQVAAQQTPIPHIGQQQQGRYTSSPGSSCFIC
ncbi:mucin-5AC-like [Homarus americanus]|uniref:mucin-5AC-like n=1 Tax=Homarus americanus TaxID=6706 RepID=UPI001C4628CC|nr:mucin-5AC-like [Homarus americanus]